MSGDLLSRIAAAQEEVSASSDVIDKVIALVEEAYGCDETIRSLEEALKAQKGRLNRIKQYELVNLLKGANMGVYNSLDGRVKAKLEMYVGGSLPKDEHDREVALQEIERVGGEAIIKTDISVRFPKQAHNMAKDFFAHIQEKLEEYGSEYDFDPEMIEGIHPKTLQSFVKEALKKGSDIDVEKLKMTHGQHVKFEFYEEKDGKMVKKKKVTTEGGDDE